jgi:hypothetical protein
MLFPVGFCPLQVGRLEAIALQQKGTNLVVHFRLAQRHLYGGFLN